MAWLLVDAMNVIGSRPDGWWRDRPGAIHRLAEDLSVWASSGAAREWEGLTLVIDGRPLSGLAAGDGASIEVVYAPGGRNAADDRIVELVEGDANPASLVVVTSDRELRRRVEGLGAGVRGAGWLLGSWGDGGW